MSWGRFDIWHCGDDDKVDVRHTSERRHERRGAKKSSCKSLQIFKGGVFSFMTDSQLLFCGITECRYSLMYLIKLNIL